MNRFELRDEGALSYGELAAKREREGARTGAHGWEITPEHAEAMVRVRGALAAVGEAERGLREAIALLPVLPFDLGSEAVLAEGGYMRWSNMTSEETELAREPFWHAVTDGWDDMSESGSWEMAEAADALWQPPKDLDWD